MALDTFDRLYLKLCPFLLFVIFSECPVSFPPPCLHSQVSICPPFACISVLSQLSFTLAASSVTFVRLTPAVLAMSSFSTFRSIFNCNQIFHLGYLIQVRVKLTNFSEKLAFSPNFPAFLFQFFVPLFANRQLIPTDSLQKHSMAIPSQVQELGTRNISQVSLWFFGKNTITSAITAAFQGVQ